MAKISEIEVLTIPLLRYASPLEAFSPDDCEALANALPVIDKMIGAIAAHEDCDPERCGVYNRELIEKCLFIRSKVSEMREAILEFNGVADEQTDEDAIKMGEEAIREMGKRLGVDEKSINETIEHLDLAKQIVTARAAIEQLHQSRGDKPSKNPAFSPVFLSSDKMGPKFNA